MFMLNNNMAFFGDWETMYNTRLHQYQQLQRDYHASLELTQQLTAKVDRLTKENQ